MCILRPGLDRWSEIRQEDENVYGGTTSRPQQYASNDPCRAENNNVAVVRTSEYDCGCL